MRLYSSREAPLTVLRALLLLGTLLFLCFALRTLSLSAYTGSRLFRREELQTSLPDYCHSVPNWNGTPEACWFCEYATFHHEVTRPFPKLHAKVKFLVYSCEDSGCGGLGDRISGIVSAFFLSVALNRVFLIEYTYPFRLEETLIPKFISWHRSINLAKLRSEEISLVDSQDKVLALEQLEDLELRGVPVIRLRINRFWLGMLLWSEDADKNSEFKSTIPGSMRRLRQEKCSPFFPGKEPGPQATFAYAFHALFDFSRTARVRAEEILMVDLNTSWIDPYVAIHARVGGSMDTSATTLGWEDPQRHSIEDLNLFIGCAKEKMVKHNSTSILLFSDSIALKQSGILKAEGIKTAANTKLFHVDRSPINRYKNAAYSGNLDTFSELLILSRATCIVGSESTFSGLASSIALPSSTCFCIYSSCGDESIDFWNITEKM